MSTVGIAIAEIGVSTAATGIIASSVSADSLLTVLIGFATAFVTVVGGEVIKFLTAFLKAKTKKYEEKEDENSKKSSGE